LGRHRADHYQQKAAQGQDAGSPHGQALRWGIRFHTGRLYSRPDRASQPEPGRRWTLEARWRLCSWRDFPSTSRKWRVREAAVRLDRWTWSVFRHAVCSYHVGRPAQESGGRPHAH
jgi:hypothetical protein